MMAVAVIKLATADAYVLLLSVLKLLVWMPLVHALFVLSIGATLRYGVGPNMPPYSTTSSIYLLYRGTYFIYSPVALSDSTCHA